VIEVSGYGNSEQYRKLELLSYAEARRIFGIERPSAEGHLASDEIYPNNPAESQPSVWRINPA
jgi:hypothetical protein